MQMQAKFPQFQNLYRTCKAQAIFIDHTCHYGSECNITYSDQKWLNICTIPAKQLWARQTAAYHQSLLPNFISCSLSKGHTSHDTQSHNEKWRKFSSGNLRRINWFALKLKMPHVSIKAFYPFSIPTHHTVWKYCNTLLSIRTMFPCCHWFFMWITPCGGETISTSKSCEKYEKRNRIGRKFFVRKRYREHSVPQVRKPWLFDASKKIGKSRGWLSLRADFTIVEEFEAKRER